MFVRMSYDDVAWEKSEEVTNEWLKRLRTPQSYRAIASLIAKHHGGVGEEIFPPTRGGFNIHLKMRFRNGGHAMIRFPDPGRIKFPEEKIRKEVAVIRLLQEQTTIPVPFILHYGMTDESPFGLGPFIIMEYIEHAYDLVDALNTPGLAIGERPILDPNIAAERLEYVYGQIAHILLQLSKLSFPRIGAPLEVKENSWSVTERPLTMNMTELVQLGNFPPTKLPSSTFDNASSYFCEIAQTHLTHLSTQRNDAIESTEDCHRKYLSRHLFLHLANDSRLNDPKLVSNPAKLFCEDLRPTNFLVNTNFEIVAVTDWEFTYAAPAEFAFSPPFWLLLERPEYWPKGLSDWAATYESRLQTFLHVLEDKEKVELENGTLKPEDALSGRMRQSWESGDFWVNYALQRSWAFDSVYWKWIDPRFFGEKMSLEQRLGLLTAEERRVMNVVVQRKLEHSKTRVLDEWDE
ncbi:MAG: hypothetical protein LQ347_004831 [Umbilicaria vellea]|nr:MAG: hypothetical protein LQ347_004831 [Umbilicaria vellea]